MIETTDAGLQLISAIKDLQVDDWQHQIDRKITGVMNAWWTEID